MKLASAIWIGLVLVVWTAIDPGPFRWLIGPGSLLQWLLPGSQAITGFEGIEGVWLVATLPVLVWALRGGRKLG